jgi:N-sulfoglucosamine sulfohydrolase
MDNHATKATQGAGSRSGAAFPTGIARKAVSRRLFLSRTAQGGAALTAAAFGAGVAGSDKPHTRPNILWIIGDDLGPELGCYGTPEVETPNLDRLAGEGCRYTRTYTTAPVCSASRSAMITGMYQTSIGAHNHRSNRDKPLPDGVALLTDLFRRAGYFTCNNQGPGKYDQPGKQDFNFKVDAGKVFDGTDWSQRPEGQPFYAQINLFEPHRPFAVPSGKRTDPGKVRLPECYPDHPVIRQDWAAYLDAIQVFDARAGAVLDRLEEEGLADNTIVFVFGDNGRPHVRDKQFLYHASLHVPLIIRWPGMIDPGTLSDALVSTLDFAPTCLDLAGAAIPSNFQGRIFLGPHAAPRRYVFGARDRCDETVDRIRCVIDERHLYIRNYYPDRPYMQSNYYKELEYPGWLLMRELNRDGLLTEAQGQFVAPTRPEEELYDLDRDPSQLDNLAESQEHNEALTRLRAALATWIEETGDQGAVPEPPETLAQVREMMNAYYVESVRRRREVRKKRE